MALTTANVNPSSGSDLYWLVGEFTTAAGDTTGTLSVGGTQMYLVNFTNYDTDSGEVRVLPVSYSTSGSVTTITVHIGTATITTGRFIIAYK